MAGLRFLATLATLQLAAGHPTFARKGQSAAAEHATHWKGPSTTTEQAVRSYHFHVQFVAGNKNSTAKALRLRSAYVERWGNESCAGLFDQDGLCMYNVDFAAMGPFVSGTAWYQTSRCLQRSVKRARSCRNFGEVNLRAGRETGPPTCRPRGTRRCSRGSRSVRAGRAETAPAGPGFTASFEKTTSAVQRRKSRPKRPSSTLRGRAARRPRRFIYYRSP